MAQHYLLESATAGARQARFGKKAGTRGGFSEFFASPTRLILTGVFGIVLLLAFFMLATLGAVRIIDTKSVDIERERAAIAVGLAQQAGIALDSPMIQKIGRDYALQDTRLAKSGQLEGHEISMPLAGSTLVLAWTPRRLGTETFVEIAPFRIGVALLVLVALVLILFRLFNLARDLEARRRAARELATTDPLTGLANRRGFAEVLDANFDSGTPLSLLYLDLDGFKLVNDNHGHAAGDQMLQSVAQRLINGVGPGDLVARIGGDEFVILHPGQATRAELHELAAGIHARVTLPYGLAEVQTSVGLSIGIAMRADHMSVNDLVAAADAALYRAKAAEEQAFVFAEDVSERRDRAA